MERFCQRGKKGWKGSLSKQESKNSDFDLAEAFLLNRFTDSN